MFPFLAPLAGALIPKAIGIGAGLATAGKIAAGGLMLASALRGPGRAPNFGGGGAAGGFSAAGSGEPLAPRLPPIPESQLPAHYIVPKDDWRAIPGTNRNGFFDSFIPTTDGYGLDTPSTPSTPAAPIVSSSKDLARQNAMAIARLLREQRSMRLPISMRSPAAGNV